MKKYLENKYQTKHKKIKCLPDKIINKHVGIKPTPITNWWDIFTGNNKYNKEYIYQISKEAPNKQQWSLQFYKNSILFLLVRKNPKTYVTYIRKVNESIPDHSTYVTNPKLASVIKPKILANAVI